MDHQARFERVICCLLDGKTMGALCSALSMCAIVLIVFVQDGGWEALDMALATAIDRPTHTLRALMGC